MEHVGFWSRMVLKFKKSSGESSAGVAIEKPRPVSATAPTSQAVPVTKDTETAKTEISEKTPGERAFQLGSRQPLPPAKTRVLRDSERRPLGSAEQRVEENEQVTKAIGRLQDGIEKQVERSDAMIQSLNRISDSLAANTKAIQTQTSLLSAIGENSSEDARQRKQFADEISQLPRIADLQRETMVSISRQLELVRESTAKVSEVLEGVTVSNVELAKETRESSKAVEHLVSCMKSRDDRYDQRIRETARQMRPIVWAVLACLVIIALSGFIGMFK